MTDISNASERIVPNMLRDCLTLAEAARRLSRSTNGRRMHVSTIWRWCRKGCKGIKLQYLRVGRTIMVSESALHKFFSELTRADSAHQSARNTSPKRKPRRRNQSVTRQREIESANAVLRRAGILTDAQESHSLQSGGVR